MKIKVNADKIYAELGPDYGCTRRSATDKLTQREVQALVVRLQNPGKEQAEIAERMGVNHHNYAVALLRAKEVLGVRDDYELGLLAYDRGYVVMGD